MVIADRRNCVNTLISFELSVIKACRLSGLSKASYYRGSPSWRKREAAVIDSLSGVLKQSPQFDFWKCSGRIPDQGHRWNHKRIYRVRCLMCLNLPCRPKRVIPKCIAQSLEAVVQANH